MDISVWVGSLKSMTPQQWLIVAVLVVLAFWAGKKM